MSMDEFAELRDKAKHLAQFGCDVFVSFSLMDDYDMKKVAHDAMEVGEAYGKLLDAYEQCKVALEQLAADPGDNPHRCQHCDPDVDFVCPSCAAFVALSVMRAASVRMKADYDGVKAERDAWRTVGEMYAAVAALLKGSE